VIAPAVAKAAMDDGVALRPIKDFDAYRNQLQQFVYHSGTLMKPLFSIAKRVPANQKRIVFAEGENERVLRAVQIIIDDRPPQRCTRLINQSMRTPSTPPEWG
jgi:malate dehydrogenase (oxaloacetate-decarboxylating)(NADP+)